MKYLLRAKEQSVLLISSLIKTECNMLALSVKISEHLSRRFSFFFVEGRREFIFCVRFQNGLFDGRQDTFDRFCVKHTKRFEFDLRYTFGIENSHAVRR